MANTNDHGAIAAVFFDLGDTLGTATVGGQPPRLIRFDVFPFILGVLADLQAKGLRLGVISNTGDENAPAMNAVLQPTGLLALLDPALLILQAALASDIQVSGKLLHGEGIPFLQDVPASHPRPILGTVECPETSILSRRAHSPERRGRTGRGVARACAGDCTPGLDCRVGAGVQPAE